ncbi:MAG: lytic transglycosylase domain-containing protein [Longimicrobiales bacterium]
MMTHSESALSQRRLVSRSGVWQWESGASTVRGRSLFGPGPASAIIGQWERESRGPLARPLHVVWGAVRRHIIKVAALVITFAVGATLASGPDSAATSLQLRDKLRRTEVRLKARQGELALVRMEIGRLNSIIEHSRRYKIPADLAASIYDISLSEGIDPKIAFALVSVESDFLREAVSHKGAIGLTQVMPATAKILDPTVNSSDLFDRETNLRIGFRFLREMLTYYKGDLNLALTAYNRGPSRVDEIRKAGRNPANGYAQSVLSGGQ